MTRIYLRSLMIAALSTLIFSCSKDDKSTLDTTLEPAVSRTSEAPLTTWFVTLPVEGVEPTPTLYAPKVPDSGAYSEPKSPSENILTPTSEYVKETCKFDFSHLPTGTVYNQVNNKNLNMAFINSTVMRLKPVVDPFGWPAHWGFSPNVENDRPEVLYCSNSEIVILVFSKPVAEFGFEIAPNQQNTDFIFTAFAGNYRYDDSAGHITVNPVRTPSGARLLAVKSSKPFSVLTINQVRTTNTDPHAGGFAMANIRYKLAK